MQIGKHNLPIYVGYRTAVGTGGCSISPRICISIRVFDFDADQARYGFILQELQHKKATNGTAAAGGGRRADPAAPPAGPHLAGPARQAGLGQFGFAA